MFAVVVSAVVVQRCRSLSSWQEKVEKNLFFLVSVVAFETDFHRRLMLLLLPLLPLLLRRQNERTDERRKERTGARAQIFKNGPIRLLERGSSGKIVLENLSGPDSIEPLYNL